MSPIHVIVALSVVVALFVGKELMNWLFKTDVEAANRHRAASHLAATLKAMGLKDIPEFLTDYSIGDLPAMYEKIHDMAKAAQRGGEAGIVSEFDAVFQNVLAIKLANPEGRAYIAALLADATPAPAAKAA